MSQLSVETTWDGATETRDVRWLAGWQKWRGGVQMEH